MHLLTYTHTVFLLFEIFFFFVFYYYSSFWVLCVCVVVVVMRRVHENRESRSARDAWGKAFSFQQLT